MKYSLIQGLIFYLKVVHFTWNLTHWNIQKYYYILNNFSLSTSRMSQLRKQFPWQAKDEVVLLFTREYPLNFIKNNLTNYFTIVWWAIIIGILVFVFFENFILSLIIWLLIFIVCLSILFTFRFKTYLIVTNKRILLCCK